MEHPKYKVGDKISIPIDRYNLWTRFLYWAFKIPIPVDVKVLTVTDTSYGSEATIEPLAKEVK